MTASQSSRPMRLTLPNASPAIAALFGAPARRKPTTPYRFERVAASCTMYRVAWRHGGNTIGWILKPTADAGWSARAQRDGDPDDTISNTVFTTRAAAAEWIMAMTNVPKH
jgi:hypothetical protein